METDISYLIAEVGTQKESTLTPPQIERLASLDWYIDTELPLVMQEGKEIGPLQAHWRHADRMNKYLMEGIPSVIIDKAKVQGSDL